MKLKAKDNHEIIVNGTYILVEPGNTIELNLDDYWLVSGSDELERLEFEPESDDFEECFCIDCYGDKCGYCLKKEQPESKDWNKIKRLSKKLREHDESKEKCKKCGAYHPYCPWPESSDECDLCERGVEHIGPKCHNYAGNIKKYKPESKEIEMPPIFIDAKGDHVDSDNKLNLWMEQVTSAINSMRRGNG